MTVYGGLFVQPRIEGHPKAREEDADRRFARVLFEAIGKKPKKEDSR